MSHKRGHTETGPQFKVLSERLEKQVMDFVIPGLVVKSVIPYNTTAPLRQEAGPRSIVGRAPDS